ncbi:MAG: response regulator, partial [Abitibacteriaceae bacterium]|nr:response regulator [Abditibacteriaceae bacterium]
LPTGWDAPTPGFVIEVMPTVDVPEAINLSIQGTEPDILLLDADYHDMDAFGVAEKALTVREGLSVIIIASDSAPDRLRRAMMVGAEDYLIKPLDVSTLRESITGIASHRTLRTVEEEVVQPGEEAAGTGLVVGVVSGKGGLGKTTLAVNMAALVAKIPGRTASLVGLESGDGAVMLNVNPKLGLIDMANSENPEGNLYTAEWLKQFGTGHRSGLTFWCWQGSGTQPAAGLPEDFYNLLFDGFRRTSSVTLVDFPLFESADVAAAVLPLLDIIIVVSSSSDLLALRSTKTFLDMVPEEINQRVRIIINRADPSDMISREDFEQQLEYKVAASIPNQPNIAAEAINMGSPFVLTQPQSDLSVSLRALATSLFKLPPPDEQNRPRKRFGFF